jgi:hypothetical protein
MSLQHTDSGEIAAISNVRRWKNASESDRIITVIGQPPRSQLKFGHASRIEERQLMQIRQGIYDIIVGCIDNANSVHETACSQETM